MNAANVKLHIERLVLDGLDLAPEARGPFQVALEAELARLITAGGLGAELLAGGAFAALQGGSLQLQPGATPQAMGAQVAQAVYAGIGGGGAGK